MKFTKSLALSLTVVVLLALGAIGFADKTEELQLNAPVSGATSPEDKSVNDYQNHQSEPGAVDEQNNMYEPGHNMDDM